MEEKLKKLYNTMSLITTKGEDTRLMGVCLQFVEQLIAEAKAADEAAKAPKSSKAAKTTKSE